MKKRKIDYSLYLVTDETLVGNRALEEVVYEAVEGGCTVVQLREKKTDTSGLLAKALSVKKRINGKNVTLIINDYPEIALKCGADGVHLGQSDMNPAQARKLLGDKAIIGLSVETLEQAEAAKSEPVDYLGVSPVFTTPTKTDTGKPWGLNGLKRVRKKVDYPLVAIGSINISNVQQVIHSGADGVAVVSAICKAEDVRLAARQLRDKVDKSKRALNVI